jgi:hypothetical protein
MEFSGSPRFFSAQAPGCLLSVFSKPFRLKSVGQPWQLGVCSTVGGCSTMKYEFPGPRISSRWRRAGDMQGHRERCASGSGAWLPVGSRDDAWDISPDFHPLRHQIVRSVFSEYGFPILFFQRLSQLLLSLWYSFL